MQLTVIDAEADGVRFSHGALDATQPAFASRGFSGTTERRCVAPDSLSRGPLRSGEFIARSAFTGRGGFRAQREQKILWLPLHAPPPGASRLLLRAARLGHPSDTLRFAVHGPVFSHGDFGYPSSVQFPTAGDWIIVVTMPGEWGCFVLPVAPRSD